MIAKLKLVERMVDLRVTLPSLLKEADEHTLIVIGNGFDIAHKIKSKYTDFRDWLIENGRQDVVYAIQTYFQDVEDKNGNWGDVETALGFYNEKSILSECKPREEFDYDHSISSAARITDSVGVFFKPILDDFRELFHRWVDSLNVDNITPILRLPEKARYLTFNYTETLEKCYNISPDNVVHIHGSRLTPDGGYVFGHFLKKDLGDVWGDEISMVHEIEAHENVVRWMNEWYKPTEDYIMAHRDLFWHLNDINRVIFIGKTINKVDEDYFSEIQDHISKSSEVFMTYHEDNEPFLIDDYITKEGLPFEKWRLIKW